MTKEVSIKLRSRISESRRFQEAVIDMIGDAAILAVEQVQSTRTRILEEKIEEDLKSNFQFLDVLLSLLTSVVVGSVLKGIISITINKTIQNRALGLTLTPNDVGTLGPSNDLARTLSREIKVPDLFPIINNEVSKFLYEGIIDFTLTNLSDAWRKNHTIPKPKYTGRPATDAAEVVVLDLIQNFKSKQKRIINLMHDQMDISISEDIVPLELDATVIKRIESQATIPSELDDKNMTSIKTQLRIFLEACIWVALLNPSKNIMLWGHRYAGGPFERLNIDEKLHDYLLNRFPHPGYYEHIADKHLNNPIDLVRLNKSFYQSYIKKGSLFRQQHSEFEATGYAKDMLLIYLKKIELEFRNLGVTNLLGVMQKIK